MAEPATTQDTLFDQLTSWENLYGAARKTRLGKRRYADCARFELERERELLCLARLVFIGVGVFVRRRR